MSSAYIKDNLFHQSKPGRDVELQNTHIVLFKSPRDVMQVSTFSAQLGLRAQLVDWYQDATSVPYGNFLIDLSPRTDDSLRYWTNTGSIVSKFNAPECLNHLKTLDDEHTWSLHCHVFQPFSDKCKNLFLQFCPKELIRFLCECIGNLMNEDLQGKKTHHVTKFQNNSWLLFFVFWITWMQRKDVLASKNGLQLIEVNIPAIINLLLEFAAVCFHPCFCVQQQQQQQQREFENSGSCKTRASRISGCTKSHLPQWFASKGIEEKTVCHWCSLVDKIFSFPVSSFQIPKLFIGWCRNWIFTDRLCLTTAS